MVLHARIDVLRAMPPLISRRSKKFNSTLPPESGTMKVGSHFSRCIVNLYFYLVLFATMDFQSRRSKIKQSIDFMFLPLILMFLLKMPSGSCNITYI